MPSFTVTINYRDGRKERRTFTEKVDADAFALQAHKENTLREVRSVYVTCPPLERKTT